MDGLGADCSDRREGTGGEGTAPTAATSANCVSEQDENSSATPRLARSG
jgi:hypothetical protein